jgi:hypothetical protein
MSDVDSFDDNDVSDWQDFAGTASTMSHRISSSHAQSGRLSMKLTYTVGAGGYAGVERTFSPGPDWSAATALSLWVYGAGSGHRFVVQLYDAGGERWESAFLVDFTGWRLQTLPFAAFTPSSFQPSGAVVDGRRDLAGIQGLALIPAASGSSTVYVDSLALSATAVAPSGTGGRAGTGGASGTGGVSGIGGASGTGGVSGIGGASGTGGAPVAPPPATGATATLIPLYSYPTDASWTVVASAKLAHPTVPVVAIVNPDNGPGSSVDTSYTSGIAKLRAAGVKVIGYVYTSYGARGSAEVRADIDRWRTFYPGVSGIFFDEQANTTGLETYYKALSTYVKQTGMDFTVGNPGADTAPSYVGTVDLILIYESAGVPSLASLDGWHRNYDRGNFGVIPYGCPTSSAAFVQSARDRVGYIYLQSDTLPNPWDTVPSYLSTLLGQLQ